MKLEKFYNEIKNNNYDLYITLQNNKIIVEAEEPEFNHDFYEIMADVDFIENLKYELKSDVELIITPQ